VLQALASMLKFKLNGMALHIYDVFYTARDNHLMLFLFENYRSLAIGAIAALVVSALLLTIAFRLERPAGMNWAMRGGGVMVAVALCFAAFPRAKTHDSDYLPFTAGYNAAALYFSLAHIPYLFIPPPIASKLADVEPDKPFTDAVNCGALANHADLVLVLAESQAPLALEADASGDFRKLFQSGDGKVRALNVETFGAGTWMTNFSVLTGLSTADFGWQAPYVNKLMQDRIRGSLPDILSRCGYKTIALMSLQYHAINEGPFLKSLGFDEVYDADAMKLGTFGVRDKAYYDFVQNLITTHRQTDKRPLFIAMQTMFTHGPFNVALAPPADPVVAPFSSDPDVNEYIRRVLVSRQDFADFLASRKREPGPRGTVVAEFGDHQATATKRFVEASNFGHDDTINFASKMYETFYSVHGYGADVDYGQLPSSEDAAFLPARILSAAGLPISSAFADLARLSDLCSGRFHLCAERAEIDKHLKARLQTGLLMVD